jgi:DNA-3-methyladenine glycosylase
MFGPPGRAYVYLVYGMYNCLNVVTGAHGNAAAVLIRAVEPLEGAAAMRSAREQAALARGRVIPRRVDDTRLASGPGRLCDAFRIGLWANGLDLLAPRSELRIEGRARTDRQPDATWSARIGVAHAGDPWATIPWRLTDQASPSLSPAR